VLQKTLHASAKISNDKPRIKTRWALSENAIRELASTRLRDQDQLDGASNYVIWKARISCLLDEHDLKTYVNSVVVVPADADPLKKYKAEMGKTKRIILDGVRDHVVSYIAGKDTAQ